MNRDFSLVKNILSKVFTMNNREDVEPCFTRLQGFGINNNNNNIIIIIIIGPGQVAKGD